MIRKKSFPFEIEPFKIRSKGKTIEGPVNVTQRKTLVLLKEAIDRLLADISLRAQMKVFLSRESVDRLEIVHHNNPALKEFIENLKAAVPDVEIKVVSQFKKKPDLPDELLYKKASGRGVNKDKNKEDFFKSLPPTEQNPNGLSDFEKALRTILSKGDSLE